MTGDLKGNETKTSASLEMKYPVINVYDTSTLRKKKVLAGSEVGAREYVSLSFTSDGKMIAAQGHLDLILNSFHTSTFVHHQQILCAEIFKQNAKQNISVYPYAYIGRTIGCYSR